MGPRFARPQAPNAQRVHLFFSMYLTASFMADSTRLSASASTSAASTLLASAMARAALDDGSALIDLPGQVEIAIEKIGRAHV